jgi:hypothetical protein
MNGPQWNLSIAHSVRKTSLLCLGLASLWTATAAQTAQTVAEQDFVGTWTGRYAGASSGTFVQTMTQNAEGKVVAGSGSSRPDDGSEASPWLPNLVEFANGTLTITSVDPSNGLEVRSVATIEGSSIKGTYTVWAPDGTEVDRGTFTGTKQPATEASP